MSSGKVFISFAARLSALAGLTSPVTSISIPPATVYLTLTLDTPISWRRILPLAEARASSHHLPLPGATVRATAALLEGFTDMPTSLLFPFGTDCCLRGCCSRGGAFCWAPCFAFLRAAYFTLLPTTTAQVSAFLAVLG